MDPDREEDLRVESHQAVSARRVVPLTDGVDKAAAKGESEKSAAKVSVERLVNKGVIAITGGTGALGLIVAKYLIERGARRLMLLSRSGECRHADLPLRAELDDVAFRLNARIEVLRLDVSDGAAIHGFCVRRGTELTGVVHAAGVANDGMLASRTSSTLEQTLAPKLVGAMRLGMILDAVRRGRGCGPLALEVYFSSVTALVGNAGQTDYGTANAGLDALAAARRQQSRTRALVSIQWGPWADHGMASVAKNSGGGTSRAPFIPLGTTQALTHFDVALHRAFEEHLGTPSVAIVRFDAKALRDAARNSAFVRKMTEQLSDERDIGTAVGVPTVAQSLKKVDPSATVLGIFSGYSKDADSQLNFATPVSALALDSLDAMAVVQELNATTGARFNVLDVLSAPTLGDIVQACPHATIEAMPVNGETEVAAPLEENPGDIAKIIAGIVAKHSARAEVVTSGTSLSSLALDSLEVTGIVNDINNAIGGDVNMVDALQAETIDDLIATARGHVSEASKAPSVASPDVQTMSKLTTSSVSIDIEGGRQCGHSGEHDSNNAELTPAKPLSEPSLSYRLYFTILSYILVLLRAYFL
ncbi:hypothetical protein CTAYLR_000745 [Chrysophaeum taylorii]|uniref:Carrier domain-containing protein n=1 Tax=Chrysophaeum taylorii TaxID=2483200 RepID=A0AAD7UP75_9STRA|nr:hypothetical protein CTAYLR_000745 [Chrysophaeum taylorii]